MALSYTQITGQFLDAQGNALTGTAEFSVNVPLYASGVPVMVPGVPVTAQIVGGRLENSSGGTLQLVDLASAGLVIEGSQTGFWFYTVSVAAGGQALAPWSFFLEHSATPVDLYSLAATPAGGAPVTSVFGRTGAVAAEAGDYTAAETGADPAGTATAATAYFLRVFAV